MLADKLKTGSKTPSIMILSIYNTLATSKNHRRVAVVAVLNTFGEARTDKSAS